MTDVNHLSPPGSYRTAATLQDQPKVQQWQPDSNTCSRAAWKDPKAANRRKISPKCRASSRYSTSKKKNTQTPTPWRSACLSSPVFFSHLSAVTSEGVSSPCDFGRYEKKLYVRKYEIKHWTQERKLCRKPFIFSGCWRVFWHGSVGWGVSLLLWLCSCVFVLGKEGFWCLISVTSSHMIIKT